MNLGKICTLSATIFCVACSKTTTTPRFESEKTVAVASTRSFTRDLGNTILTVKLTPVVLCFSYPNGGTPPRPCTITVRVVCELSNPISGSVQAELLKTDESGYNENGKHVGSEHTPLTMVMSIPANASKATFETNFDCPDNYTVPDLFRLGAVSVFRRIH